MRRTSREKSDFFYSTRASKLFFTAQCVSLLSILPGPAKAGLLFRLQAPSKEPAPPLHDSEALCPEGKKSPDSDRDGLCDELEKATGTDPLHPDTDRDSVPDGVEDKNLDGVVNPGESDPRSAGLFPGSSPHIPEPLAFDLVRGLGAKKGELEVNTLFIAHLRGPNGAHLNWAPEVEWAFADGFAVELELPLHNRELQAIKGAFQATFPSPTSWFIHGAQAIFEGFLGEGQGHLSSLVYLAGTRSGNWSFFSMFGGRLGLGSTEGSYAQAIVNPSLFYDVAEDFTLGIETNLLFGGVSHEEYRFLPQLHYQISKKLRVQLGCGVIFQNGEVDPVGLSRIILE